MMDLIFRIYSLAEKQYKLLLLLIAISAYFFNVYNGIIYIIGLSIIYFLLDFEFINKIFKFNKEYLMKELIVIIFLFSVTDIVFYYFTTDYVIRPGVPLDENIKAIIFLLVTFFVMLMKNEKIKNKK